MKVLFVSSGNSITFPIAPFIKSQGESLIRNSVELEYFTIVGNGFRGYLKNIRRLKRVVKDTKPDIIHSHYSLSGWISIFANRKKAVVLSLMGSDVHGGNTKLLVNFILMIQVFMIQLFNKVIIIKSKNLSNGLWAKKKCRIIPNGVNFDVFVPMDKKEVRKKLNLENDKKYILFAANPKDSNKNFALLKEAIEQVKTKNIGILTPFPVPHRDMADYYNSCDLLVFPSILEGSPNVIKEALACNTRIIATDSGDIRERGEGIDSITFCRYDSRELAMKIDEQINNTQPVTSRKKISDELDEDKIAARLIDIYNSLV